jgi:hypothetical protein
MTLVAYPYGFVHTLLPLGLLTHASQAGNRSRHEFDEAGATSA